MFLWNINKLGEWEVSSIERDSKTREVTAFVLYKKGEVLVCPECGKSSKLHDHRVRKWRHLDTQDID
jgi:transposase